jgi:hypothetical protein
VAEEVASSGESPLLVFESAGVGRLFAAAAGVGTSVFVFIALIAVTEGKIPFVWIDAPWVLHDSFHFLDHHPWVPWSIVVGSGVLVALALRRLFGARVGPVEVRAEGVVLGERTVGWSEFAAYRDDSARFVTLLPRAGGSVRSVVRLRTRDEALRARLLAVLDGKGLVREERS